jgi:predicted tellurium resistance membrane protein TerC
MEAFFSLDGLISLLTLTLLEIVLGIDNIIFISIFSSKLPAEQQPKARSAGIFIALAMRVVMLLGIAWIIKLDEPLFSVFEKALSIKDLILLSGGIFLIAKTTSEMHSKLEKK